MAGKRKKPPESYRHRSYRQQAGAPELHACQVQVRETDLQILAPVEVHPAALQLVIQYRNQLENFLPRQPRFLEALSPLPDDPTAPPLVRAMLQAALLTEVGPMAAVAGVIAEFVGRDLLKIPGCDEVVVENGGDIFLSRQRDCTIAIFAASSSLSNRVGLKIRVAQMPCGVCTSSATVGHSLSLGRADAVTVVAANTALADAAATRIGNLVKSKGDLGRALEVAAAIPGLIGVVIIIGEELGAWGDLELVEVGGAAAGA
ncbi:MAG: UPF0280 family protein [Desulfobulbaceae bacterium]|nr:UPF0280 family protein [Desulfobulbaceae bacterium]